MFLKTHTAEDRLKIWRDIRQNKDLSLSNLLEKFSKIKQLSRYLDYYTPSSWPTPFEIVHEGYLCQSGITLVLTATLLDRKFVSQGTLELPVISNNINGNTGLVLIEGDKVFNFEPDKVVDLNYLKLNSTRFQTHFLESDQLLR